MKIVDKQIVKEILFIFALSVLIAFVYNHFSGRGISLMREKIDKTQTSDSELFDNSRSRSIGLADSAVIKDIKVIAPLHEQALRNQDSMANLYREKKKSPYNIISLSQLNRLLKEHRGVVIDARNKDDYQKGHIKTAINVPALEAEKYFDRFIKIARDTIVVIYCNSDECHLAHTLADLMKQFEFTKIYIYDQGWDGWLETKMPVDSSESKY